MGCDIHCYAEKRLENGPYQKLGFHPFDYRNYGVFAFLAGVRNYSGVQPISFPRGIPLDASDAVCREYERWGADAHSASWSSLEELLSFDYSQMMEDRRVTRQIKINLWSGAHTCDPGDGKKMTVSEFLGDEFFKDLEELKSLGADRIVFWFDN